MSRGRSGRRSRWEGVLGALGALSVAAVSLVPRWWDPMTSEEASGVRGAGWTALLSGWDAPTNPPVLLWIANALAEGPAVVEVGRALALVGSLGAAAGVGWIVGRRGGWELGAVLGAALGWMPPLLIDGVRVRGYGPAALLMVLHLGAWLRVMEGGGRRARVARVLAGGAVAYAHYLAAPLLVIQGLALTAVSPNRRRDLVDLTLIVACWLPTLGWILGDGNAPRVSEQGVDRVLWHVLAFSTQRAPVSWPPLTHLWPTGLSVALVPAALLLMGPLSDRRARGLRWAALGQLAALVAAGQVWLVRAPAAALVLPVCLVALGVGLTSLRWPRAVVAGVPMTLWLVSGLQHRVLDDPSRRQLDGRDALAVLTSERWADRRVWVPNQGTFVLLDLLHHGAPFDAPGRSPEPPTCVQTPGADLCRGLPEGEGWFLRQLPREALVPAGYVAISRGRGWVVLRRGG